VQQSSKTHFCCKFLIILYLLHHAQHLDFEDRLIDYGWVHPCLEFMSVLTHNYLFLSPIYYYYLCILYSGMFCLKCHYFEDLLFFTWGPKNNRTPTKIFLWKKWLKVAMETFFSEITILKTIWFQCQNIVGFIHISTFLL
jgi:hypothetical protein